MDTILQRRSFLKGAANLFLGSAIVKSPLFAKAQLEADVPRFFVLIVVSGGMDSTLGLEPFSNNPSEKDLFLGYRPDEIIQAGGLSFGPAAKALVPFANSLVAVNGIVMHETNVDHGANLVYATSAKGAGLPDFPLTLGTKKLGSRGVLVQGGVNTGMLDKFSITAPIDLVALSSKSINLDFICSQLPGQSGGFFDEALIESCKARQETSTLFSTFRQLQIENALSGVSVSERMILAAFASSVAFQAKINLSVNGTIDSHANHFSTQMSSQTDAWNHVAQIFNAFKATPFKDSGKSLFDTTVFAVVTDFTRTPALNASQGKDHNPQSNSFLLAGGPVKGNQSIGGSRLISRANSLTGASTLWGLPVNAQNIVASNQAELESTAFDFISPERVYGALLGDSFSTSERIAMGLDPAKFPPLKGILR